MELKANHIQGWSRYSPPEAMKNASACLIFGPDAGGATDLCLSLIGTEERITLEGGAITREAISSHTDTMSLFGGGTTVLVRGATDKHVKEFEPLLAGGINPGSRVIVQAGNLKGNSKLKKLFASNKDAVSVALYPMKGNEITTFAKSYAKECGCELDRSANSAISQELSGDRARSARMMETICLHAIGAGRKNVLREDIIAVCHGIDENDLSAPFDQALSGNLSIALTSLDDKILRGENPIALLRIFSYRAFRYLTLAQSGKSAQNSVNQAKPPIFWSEKDLFIRVLSRHDSIALQQIIVLIDRTEDKIVEGGVRPSIALPDMLLKIAKGNLKWPKP
jgi:DNA polymerase III delta subunit